MKETKTTNLIFSIVVVFFVIGIFYQITKVSENNKNNKIQKVYVSHTYDKSLKIISNIKSENLDNKKNSININNFNLKIVDTNESRKNGLSNTKNLCDMCAMLFVFEKEGLYPFWMKDMSYDLDIIYIKEELIKEDTENKEKNSLNKNIKTKKIISEIFENIKVSSYPDTTDTNMLSSYVLEINSGKVKELNIKVGDEIKF